MAGLTAHGAAFVFLDFRGDITGISIESPSAEVTNMTSASDPVGHIVMVPTGEIAGGTITVDFLAKAPPGSGAAPLPTVYVKKVGSLFFASPSFACKVNVVCESASISAQSGDLIKGTLRFRPTDYYPAEG